jgi:hypothetical protein
MAIRNLITAASFLAVDTWAAPKWIINNGTGTGYASGLQSCAAAMDGQLPSTVPLDFHFSGNVRRYYIAAEEVEWDYAPTGWDNWLGVCTKLQDHNF